ncbi:hypothetical protein TUM17569_49260 [Klebsiella oxytoca]|jgi:hypothetical protein|uniref:Uncharacterized protein n=1 Tax=Klebsiella grimontii TaxID=2058152 RepID=A0A285AZ87_9ENTR|nr:hypothetical protein TUM17559_49700 [Enterobacter cloacae]GJK90372.1 hypothetical protein TUM17568_15780 [Klebsiella oxytoca]GJK99465.1 hypothetical protein TUM17569_49260 [Klebsiella oxytoca]GJL14848.1 hypothetical protein TUM17572_46550 [Klebsiella oxytoca]SNU33948.1 hypothetical protein KOSB73_220067 [Klebsiella grimontii]
MVRSWLSNPLQIIVGKGEPRFKIATRPKNACYTANKTLFDFRVNRYFSIKKTTASGDSG